MPRLPAVTPKECMKALERAGFYLDRVRGSHHHYRRLNRRGTVTIAMHGGTLKRKTLASIIKQAGMTVDEFVDLL